MTAGTGLARPLAEILAWFDSRKFCRDCKHRSDSHCRPCKGCHGYRCRCRRFR